MRRNTLLSGIIAGILILCLAFSSRGLSTLTAFAEQDQELASTYVSEIKMFYGASLEDAASFAQAEGFTLSSQNVMAGTNTNLQGYLGYKTTKDPGEAITDMSLLDMKNSHYEKMTYKEYLDKHVGEYSDLASRIMILVNEFRKQYQAGNPNAIAALDSLNLIYMDNAQDHAAAGNLLGNYILEQADASFFAKYAQRGNAQILSAILNYLSGAATDWGGDGTTWADRAKNSSVATLYSRADSAERNQYDTWYQDPALRLISEIQIFAQTYQTAKSLNDQYGDTFGYAESHGLSKDSTLEEIMEVCPDCRIPEYINALTTYEMLNQVVYQEASDTVGGDAALLYEGEPGSETAAVTATERKTLADLFLELAADGNLAQHPETVYPLIDGMTTAQRTVLDLCGLGMIVRCLYSSDNYEAERSGAVSEREQELKDLGFTDGKIWLWQNVDTSMYDKKAAETSELIEARDSGKDLKNSENEAARKAASTLTMALRIADISLLALSGITMVIEAIVGASLWELGMACFWMSGLAMSSGMVGFTIGYGIAGALACACYVLSIVVLVASLAYLVYTLLDMFGAFDEPELADYTTIPNILFHVRTNQKGSYQVRYDAVTSNFVELTQKMYENSNGFEAAAAGMFLSSYGANVSEFADMGGFLGYDDRWMTLYTTKAPAAGDPIRVAEDGSIIQLSDNYQKKDGLRAVTLINGSEAADIHSISINGETGTPTYMFFITDPEKVKASEAEPETVPAETPSDTGQYVTRVQLAHASKKADAQNSLKNNGFLDIIDVNLTPYEGYTYIGYQLGSEENALTDIRISTQGVSAIEFGDASYAMAGVGSYATTPDGMALYVTTSKAAGTPIKRISVESKRLALGSGAEPVCLFSGGNAVDLMHKWSDNVNFSMATYQAKSTRKHLETRTDALDEGNFIYFWPKEEYKAPEGGGAAPYVAGFSYFLGANHDDYIKELAAATGFELVQEGSSAARMMSGDAAYMNPIYSWKDKEGGALGHDWTYHMYHYMSYGGASNFSDGSTDNFSTAKTAYNDEDFQGYMYFGVSYTWNPYRAITGVMGLVAPYTETTHSLRFTGLKTPAGTLQSSTVSIMGNPVTQAGISLGYFNYSNMNTSLYTRSRAKTKSDLPWMTTGETEVLSRYLLACGPAFGREPIGRDEIAFVTDPSVQNLDGYAPICDLRTPGDYEHRMNFALETTNLGSEYLYIYLRADAGGRVGETTDSIYQKKHYIAAVFCGTGKTPEEAINNLYSRAAANWPTLSAGFPDISAQPLTFEFDEIFPIDLAKSRTWYDYALHETDNRDPGDNEWVRGNDAAEFRWSHDNWSSTFTDNHYVSKVTPDDEEGLSDHVYLGVIRTSYSRENGAATITKTDENGVATTTPGSVYPVYALMKYYTNESTVPNTLRVGDVNCTLAGGPVKSPEGTYYLYYSTNSATASFSAPVTEIDLSKEEFINGYNSCFSCYSSDRKDNKLPAYNTLRLRTDEFLYIHTKYDMQDLPYIEHLYLGIGDNRKEAYADLVGTTNANAASEVNCNYNSFSKKWIAIGYRRTNNEAHAIRDFFLYSGENPQSEIEIPGYAVSVTKSKGKVTTDFTEYNIPYRLIAHNLTSGSEPLSLNEGSGGTGLYLYYTTGSGKRIAYEKEAQAELLPIRNIAYGYGDLSPAYASTEDLAELFSPTVHGMKVFDPQSYANPCWEFVCGVEGASPAEYKIDLSNGRPMSLNYGQLPMMGNNERHAGDKRIMMYIDRSSVNGNNSKTRCNAKTNASGYFSYSTSYGILTQTGQ